MGRTRAEQGMQRVHLHRCGAGAGRQLGELSQIAEITDTPVAVGTQAVQLDTQPPAPAPLSDRRRQVAARVRGQAQTCRWRIRPHGFQQLFQGGGADFMATPAGVKIMAGNPALGRLLNQGLVTHSRCSSKTTDCAETTNCPASGGKAWLGKPSSLLVSRRQSQVPARRLGS